MGPLAATASAQPGQVDKSGLAAFRDATCVHATASAEPSEQGPNDTENIRLSGAYMQALGLPNKPKKNQKSYSLDTRGVFRCLDCTTG